MAGSQLLPCKAALACGPMLWVTLEEMTGAVLSWTALPCIRQCYFQAVNHTAILTGFLTANQSV